MGALGLPLLFCILHFLTANGSRHTILPHRQGQFSFREYAPPSEALRSVRSTHNWIRALSRTIRCVKGSRSAACPRCVVLRLEAIVAPASFLTASLSLYPASLLFSTDAVFPELLHNRIKVVAKREEANTDNDSFSPPSCYFSLANILKV